MLAHLVALRPGLWWQTTGDEEESSALQFRKVPMKHLRPVNHGSLCVYVCACVLYILAGRCLCSCRPVDLIALALNRDVYLHGSERQNIHKVTFK